MSSFIYQENNVYYCDECKKIYNACYEFNNYNKCRSCFGDIEVLPEGHIKAFIRKKRLEYLKHISDERY